MLAYRHAFHAGNHADVLKHLVLTEVLRYMAGKGKPLRYVDTHAGAGGYRLKAAEAKKTAEYQRGIGALWHHHALTPGLDALVALVRAFNRPEGAPDDPGAQPPLALYPGSPALARMLLPRGTGMSLYEMHPADVRTLAAHFGGARSVQVHHGDGFAALQAAWPPTPRRAVVLVDPSYEQTADYGRTVALLRGGVQRFPQGTYIVWYPQLPKIEAVQLPKRLTALAPAGWLHVRMTVSQPDAQGFGLGGSGMVVINPPYSLHQFLQAEMPTLTAALAQFDGANFLLEHRPD